MVRRIPKYIAKIPKYFYVVEAYTKTGLLKERMIASTRKWARYYKKGFKEDCPNVIMYQVDFGCAIKEGTINMIPEEFWNRGLKESDKKFMDDLVVF